MIEEDHIQMQQDRLERLLTAPDTVSQEEISLWMDDEEFVSLYETAMDTRRSLLSLHGVPDGHEAFLKFREERMQPVSQSGKPRRHKHIALWTVLSSAACIVLLLVLFLGRTEKTPVKQGVQVFTAKATPTEVTLSVGGEDISVSSSTDEQLAALDTKRSGKDGLSYNQDKAKTAETHTLTTPQGKDFHIRLADGTHVWLNAGSSITYPSTFEGSETRAVSLNGEAYFEVTKDSRHPFIVRHNGMTTRVTGTSFNIKSYSGEPQHVTLASGSVSVSHASQSVTLRPGQDATVEGGGTLTSRNVDTEPYVCWREGYFYFDGVTFRQMMTDIGRWYNKNVVFNSSRHLNELLHMRAERSWDITEIIQQINQISDTKVQIKGNTIIVE